MPFLSSVACSAATSTATDCTVLNAWARWPSSSSDRTSIGSIARLRSVVVHGVAERLDELRQPFLGQVVGGFGELPKGTGDRPSGGEGQGEGEQQADARQQQVALARLGRGGLHRLGGRPAAVGPLGLDLAEHLLARVD